MRLPRIKMVFQREEEIALKVLKYSTGVMRQQRINMGKVMEAGRKQCWGVRGGHRPLPDGSVVPIEAVLWIPLGWVCCSHRDGVCGSHWDESGSYWCEFVAPVGMDLCFPLGQV